MARLNWWQTILAAVVASLVAIVVTMLIGGNIRSRLRRRLASARRRLPSWFCIDSR